MATDNCSSCGARLSPTIEWCGQCYAPVSGAAPSVARTAPAAPSATPAGAPAPAPVAAVASPVPVAGPEKVLPPDFDLRVDQHLQALRTEARPIPKSAVFGVLALAVVMALAAEVAMGLVHGPALVFLALAFASGGALVARLIWKRMKPAIPTR